MSGIPDEGCSQVQANNEELYGILSKLAEQVDESQKIDPQLLLEFLGKTLKHIAEAHLALFQMIQQSRLMP